MKVQIITHDVNDYDAWKKEYDEVQLRVNELGSKEIILLQSANDPNNVTVIVEETSEGGFERFWADEEIKEAMSRAGVVGQPDVKQYTKG